MQTIKAVESPTLSQDYEPRYVIIDEDTGEVLDDAQGYGYRTKQKAHAAWAYLHRDKSLDAAKRKKRKQIRNGSRSINPSEKIWKMSPSESAKVPSGQTTLSTQK